MVDDNEEQKAQEYSEDMYPSDPADHDDGEEDYDQPYVPKPPESSVTSLSDDGTDVESVEARRIHELALLVLEGHFGLRDQRKETLGDDYDAVRDEVLRIRSSS